MKMRIIDFDIIESWGDWLSEPIRSIAPSYVFERLQSSKPEFIEDAADILLGCVNRHDLVERLRDGLQDTLVRLYHGTRLSGSALQNVEAFGLQPLNLKSRKQELVTALDQHPEWATASKRLDEALVRFGKDSAAGYREDGRIHVCFSRNGLLQGCSHYLTCGAEVDTHIVHFLFDDAPLAYELLAKHRQPYLVHFLKPFESAMQAANPFGVPTDDLPSLINLLIKSWSYRQAIPDFSPVTLQDCTAAWFEGAVKSSDIEGIVSVSDCDLNWKN